MTTSILASWIGSITGIVTVLSFLPQAVRAWKTRRTQDISRGTYILLVAQSLGWATYGLLLGQAPIVWTNVSVLVMTSSILAAKLKHG